MPHHPKRPLKRKRSKFFKSKIDNDAETLRHYLSRVKEKCDSLCEYEEGRKGKDYQEHLIERGKGNEGGC